MAPRPSGMSVSTTSSSLYTEDVGSASIDLLSLDDPAHMSPQAIKAELDYYGVEMDDTNDRYRLEQALVFARRRSSSWGSSRKGSGGGRPQHQQNPQYQRQQNALQRPTEHLEQTAANVPGVRVRSPPDMSSQPHRFNNKYSPNNLGGENPTHIPLTPNNRIPPQILNIIRISADPSMRAINLDNRNLGDREVSKLAEALYKNRTLVFLSLRNCGFADDGCKKLADMLLKNEKLVELHLDGNQIGAEGAAQLSTALITNESLAVLTLNDNRAVGDKGVVYLTNALEHNTTLRSLAVHNCGIGSSGSRNSVDRLEQIESLLADRQIDANFESLLDRLLDDDFRVTGIDLSGRRIGDKGAKRLADALADNTQVRQLWLRGCNIGDPGAKALAECLEQNMAVVDLFLGGNVIGNAGMIAISDALAMSNLTLVSLEMDDNRVGEAGLDAFVRALKKNTSVLVASFTNNPIGNGGKLDSLQATLMEKRSGLNLVSFVVDPDAGSNEGTADGNNDSGGGLVNMSVCSSYMPSTYRRAGFSSQADFRGSGGSNLQGDAPGPAPGRGSNESHRYSVYNMTNSTRGAVPVVNAPPPPPPKPPERRSLTSERRSPPAAATRQMTPERTRTSPPHAVESPPRAVASPPRPRVSPKTAAPSANKSGSSKSDRHSPSSNRSGSNGTSPSPKREEPPPKRAAAAAPPPTPLKAAPKRKPAPPRAASPPPYARSNPYQRAQVPVPLKAQALETIAEARSTSTRSTKKSSIAANIQKKSSHVGSSAAYHSSNSFTPTSVYSVPTFEEEEDYEESYYEEPKTTVKKRRRTSMADTMFGHTTITESIHHPETQRNFNETLKKLWRRVEMMKRTNHFAAAHYRSRHFWFWFVPISSSICLAVLLSLATAADVSGGSRLGLSLFTALFASFAFALNFLQSRFGWSSRAEVHRSAELELHQVAFRLDTLGKYEGHGLSTGSHSTKSRANAIRDLYRIDVYLQAMQRCTPNIPDSINEVFYLLASRLKSICQKYPNAVKLRSAYTFYDEEPNPENPVPVEMQIDALDLLGREIENYFLYPLFMPNAKDVVSRTIDIFFAKPGGGGGGGSGGETTADSQYYSEDQTTQVV
mmetsp:Transcript_4666/g.10295  ORF Transcript_4666/g.10295 Transcript_4666/m.10295 type:complete len:1107 (+) Transcript_4666:619-3939(+)